MAQLVEILSTVCRQFFNAFSGPHRISWNQFKNMARSVEVSRGQLWSVQVSSSSRAMARLETTRCNICNVFRDANFLMSFMTKRTDYIENRVNTTIHAVPYVTVHLLAKRAKVIPCVTPANLRRR
jgi:hypothetical protein